MKKNLFESIDLALSILSNKLRIRKSIDRASILCGKV
jgi:hypothetical protein